MFEGIEKLDQELFLFLNGIHSPFWDTIMWHISGKFEWIPLYIILLYLLIKQYKKQSWKLIIGIAMLIAMVDQASVRLFKEVVQRYRPCKNLDLESVVHLVNNKCGGTFGFVSSHAANTFALAVFIGLLLNTKNKNILMLLLIWATIVSYSRIYLGVHYPLDILGGAILGSSLAFMMFWLFTKRILK